MRRPASPSSSSARLCVSVSFMIARTSTWLSPKNQGPFQGSRCRRASRNTCAGRSISWCLRSADSVTKSSERVSFRQTRHCNPEGRDPGGRGSLRTGCGQRSRTVRRRLGAPQLEASALTPTRIRAQVVLERIAWTRGMLDALRRLPTSDPAAFLEDERTAAAAESYLRRALEGLLDLGRSSVSLEPTALDRPLQASWYHKR